MQNPSRRRDFMTLSTLKISIKHRFPDLVPIYSWLYWNLVRRPRLLSMSAESVFSKIYRENGWAGDESLSGLGSSLAETTEIRSALPIIIKQFSIRSMLDSPCGDGYWMSCAEIKLEKYIGADIVPELVRICAQRCAGIAAHTEFIQCNLMVSNLPAVDLIFCRDCLFHLSFKDIGLVISNIKASGSRYLLTTTYIDRQNTNIVTGEWRPIDLQAKPFSFPPPLAIINENASYPQGYADKSMALWLVADLPG